MDSKTAEHIKGLCTIYLTKFLINKFHITHEEAYKKLLNTEENLQTIRKIQPVVILYLNSRGTAFPQIEKQLKNSSSIEEQINIFLSYSQEQ